MQDDLDIEKVILESLNQRLVEDNFMHPTSLTVERVRKELILIQKKNQGFFNIPDGIQENANNEELNLKNSTDMIQHYEDEKFFRQEILTFINENQSSEDEKGFSQEVSTDHSKNSSLIKPCSDASIRYDISKIRSFKGKIACELCKKEFFSGSDLLKHCEQHFTCNICKRMILDHEQIKEDVKVGHLHNDLSESVHDSNQSSSEGKKKS